MRSMGLRGIVGNVLPQMRAMAPASSVSPLLKPQGRQAWQSACGHRCVVRSVLLARMSVFRATVSVRGSRLVRMKAHAGHPQSFVALLP